MASFSVEVPGEANPLTERAVAQTLQSASSTNATQIQTGTKQLQNWEKSPGYYRHLQSVYVDHQHPVEVRYLAIIQLKNGIEKYWRKTAANAVPKEDKAVIRGRLLQSCVDEDDNRLALQNALVIAKVARFEYPQDWPNLLTSLNNTLKNASQTPPLHTSRTLLMLLHIVKELSTARLQRSRQNLQSAAPEIVHAVGTLYAETIQYWHTRLSENVQISDDVFQAMHISLLAIKTIRRLIVMGHEHPNRDADVVSIWTLTQQKLGAFMNTKSPGEAQELLDKNMIQLAKLHQSIAKDHPAAFVLLPHTIELVRAYWGLVKDFGATFGSKEAVATEIASASLSAEYDGEHRPSAEKLALRGLLVMRACVKMVHNPAHSFKLKSAEDKQERDEAKALVKNNLLTSSFVQEMMETVVTKYFVFRASDLREWEEEPEEWEKREEGDGEDWEFSIRSCAEKLFLDLAINYKDMLSLPLLQVFYSVATPTNEDVLFKDSLYTAIGLAAPVVHEQLDFDAFVRDVLVLEIQKQKPGYNIIRRRAAILLGQWVSVKMTERQLAYQIFQHLLDRSDPLNDQVVRVTAGRQLSKLVDDFEFRATHFLPYGEVVLTRLMQLIEEVVSTETKMALLNTLSVIVERLDHHILPFAERIVSLLPPLWEASGEEHLMKQAILATLSRLVNAMKAASAPLHSLSIPIIKGAIEPGSETEVFLLDDAMDLWGSILVQSVAPASSDVMQLVPYLYPIYEIGSENLRKALEITESYVILAPEHMLAEGVRTGLFTALAELLGSLRPDANGLVCNLIEIVVRAAEQLGGDAAVTQTVADLVQTGLFGKLLQGLHGSYIAHCTTGPRAQESPVDGIVETDYFSILARVILGSLEGFCQACTASAPEIDGQAASLESTMKWLLEEWFSHFENIGDPSRRKLMCLALTRLLDTNQPFILLNLQSLMTVWTDVITELREGDEDASGDSLVYSRTGEENVPEEAESPEDTRRRELTYSDIVHKVKIPEYVKHYLNNVISTGGGRFEQEWLINVDKDVVAAFSGLGIM